MVHEFVLQNSNELTLQVLLSETLCSAVLDSGASSTVCGAQWFTEYSSSLSEKEKTMIKFETCNKPFRFGDGKQYYSSKAAIIPANIGQHKVSIKTYIIDADIPMLLSKSSMKKGGIELKFASDTISFLGDEIPLQTTTSGLYCLPITPAKQVIKRIDHHKMQDHIILRAVNTKSNKDIAIKLHRSFAHPSEEKLLKLLNSSGKEWSENVELKNEIKKVTDNCQICKIYKKPPPRPTVSLPMSNQFQETVAMDLKQFEGRFILYMIDMCTRLSAGIFIPNKNKETIIRAIFCIWIAVYGSPEKIVVDNGGEFANKDLTEMCDYLGIHIKPTAAESPWSNGIVERNNQTLANMMEKIIKDTNCSLELALSWALNAKNSLQNVAGFSPFQLVLGKNPKLPAVLSDDLPALSMKPSSEVIQENLNAIHSARKAFIAIENDRKIKRALTHNVRTTGEVKYVTGDVVFYKREDSSEWRGPGTVIGQVSQQVFIKHGSFYVRVHPCRLQLIKPASRTTAVFEKQKFPHSTHTYEKKTTENQYIEQENSSDSENEQVDNNPITHNSTERSQTIVNNTPSPVDKVTPKTKIEYKINADDDWKLATVINRAGKASGAYRNSWNICSNDGTKKFVNLDKVNSWHIVKDQINTETQKDEQDNINTL